jgi:hypothetical protein
VLGGHGEDGRAHLRSAGRAELSKGGRPTSSAPSCAVHCRALGGSVPAEGARERARSVAAVFHAGEEQDGPGSGAAVIRFAAGQIIKRFLDHGSVMVWCWADSRR